MPGDPKRRRLFLCHAKEDKDLVREIYEKLKTEGFDPWLDKEDLLPGQDWRREIPRAIRSSACALVFLSATSVAKRGYVQKEVKLALDTLDEMPEGEIFLIPIRIDECEIPDRIANIEYCNLFERDGFERMLRAIRTTIGGGPSNGFSTADSAAPAVEEVVLPISGAYKLSEEQWEPDGSVLQMINEEPPGAILSIKMDSTDSGQYQLDSSVGKYLGRVTVDGEEMTIGDDEHGATIGAVVSVDDAHLVTRRIEKDADEETYVVTSTWDRLSVTPSADFKASTAYTLFIRKLICVKAMCPADLVSLHLGPRGRWTGEIRSGYEVPLGINEDFTNAQTIQLAVWECGSTEESISEGGRVYQSEEMTISRRKAGQGQQVLRMLPENGDAELFDYEVVYEVLGPSGDR